MIAPLLLACATRGPADHGPTPAADVAPLEVTRIDGAALTRTFTRATGAPRIVSLFATWCEPCAEELPTLQRVARARGIEVTLVSVDLPEDAPRVPPWLASIGVTLPAYQYVDPELPTFLPKLMPGWPRVLPVTLVVGADGVPLRRFDGLTTEERLVRTLP